MSRNGKHQQINKSPKMAAKTKHKSVRKDFLHVAPAEGRWHGVVEAEKREVCEGVVGYW